MFIGLGKINLELVIVIEIGIGIIVVELVNEVWCLNNLV